MGSRSAATPRASSAAAAVSASTSSESEPSSSRAHFTPPLRGHLIAIVSPGLLAPGLLVTITGALE
ncbi:hypothetical protein DSI50_22215, partial [Mycobacterium tuberculosis]